MSNDKTHRIGATWGPTALMIAGGIGVLMQGALAEPPADVDHALVVDIDEDICSWTLGEYVALGTVHYVESPTGLWKLTCQGELTEDSAVPTSTQIHRSTSSDPDGYCNTPWDTTEDFQLTFSPSGQSTFTCKGQLD